MIEALFWRWLRAIQRRSSWLSRPADVGSRTITMPTKRGAKPRKAYSTRSDLEKVTSNWTKTLGLFARREYSVSIVRAAMTAELALNFVIRHELQQRHKLPADFVDRQLKDANGIPGKLDRLYLPIVARTALEAKAKAIAKELKDLNKQRNDIAHRGEFRRKPNSGVMSNARRERDYVSCVRVRKDVQAAEIQPSGCS